VGKVKWLVANGKNEKVVEEIIYTKVFTEIYQIKSLKVF